MHCPIIIVDSSHELQVIEQLHPELKRAPLILLSSNFSPHQLLSFQERSYVWFDEVITNNDSRRLSENIYHLLWEWFLDENGNDLSEIDGCSLGAAFSSSLENIFTTIARYQVGLEKLLKPNHIVYHSAHTKDLFIDACVFLQKKIGFVHCPIESDKLKKLVNIKGSNKSFDVPGRAQQFTTMFHPKGIKTNLISLFLRFFQLSARHNEKRILIMPGGKHEEYFKYIGMHGCPEKFRWIFPVNNIRNLLGILRYNRRMPLFYIFSAAGFDQSESVTRVINLLKDNLCRHTDIVDKELLIQGLSRNIFCYFSRALSYYYNAKGMFQSLKPDLAIFSSDTYEFYILAAQAAKNSGIKTAMIPHGYYGWSYAETKSGRHQVFDQMLAFGQVDVENYRHLGVPKQRIHVTSFPYFERFLPLRKSKVCDYKRALILSPDFYSITGADKIGAEFNYYKDVCLILEKLDLEVIGIKFRHDFNFRRLWGTSDSIEINGKDIPLIAGKSNFTDIVKEVDLVVGQVGTAVIEAGLMGKDYYVYHHTPFHNFTPSILPAIFDTVNAAFSIKQLEVNILTKRPYQPGKKVYDLIDLTGVQTKHDLFTKFEAGVWDILPR